MMIGAWKSISELEEELSLVEAEALIGAKRDDEHRLFRIIMASVGVDINEGVEDDSVTGDDIKNRVMAGTGIKRDIVALQGSLGEKEGFSIGLDLGYENEMPQ